MSRHDPLGHHLQKRGVFLLVFVVLGLGKEGGWFRSGFIVAFGGFIMVFGCFRKVFGGFRVVLRWCLVVL